MQGRALHKKEILLNYVLNIICRWKLNIKYYCREI